MASRTKASEKTTAKNDPTYYCTMQISKKCEEKQGVLEDSDFYRSYSSFNKNGRYHICKNCIKEFVYDKNGELDIINFKAILKVFDMPFLNDVFNDASNAKGEFIGVYFKLINLNYRTLNWDASDDKDNRNVDPNTDKITDGDLYDKWGNYPLEDLNWLERNYNEWVTNHDCGKLATRKLIMTICIKELEMKKTREKGLSTEKLEKSWLDLLNSSNLTPRTMNYTNESESTKTFGIWLRDIEKTRPCEYFEDKKIYEDFDGIKSYIERFLFRPMKNLITGSRDFDKEFQPLEFEDSDIDDVDDDDDEN